MDDLASELAVLEHLTVQTIELLERYGERYWSSELGHRWVQFAATAPRGADAFISSWGGMGGFLDLVLDPINGHQIRPDEVRSANDRLSELTVAMANSVAKIRGFAQPRSGA